MRKKLFTLLFALVASVGTMYASSTRVNGIWYNFDDNTQTASVTSSSSIYYEYSGTIVIPSSVTYNGITYSVTSIESRAFYNCTGLTSVTIPNGVTSIGYDAFCHCSRLTSIDIPNSVTSIGQDAFYGCSSLPVIDNIRYADTYLVEAVDKSLSSCVIKEGTKWIARYAFYSCRSLTSITVPNSVTSIETDAFLDCNELSSIHISDIAAWCGIRFSNYSSKPAGNLYINGELVTDLIIPNNVTSIGKYAFVGCTSLKSIEIPNSVTSIGSYAFYWCTDLTSVTIPNSVTSIGDGVFAECSSLPVIDNIRYADTYLVEAVDKSLSSCVIKEGTKWIGSYAFSNCTGLTSIKIPNSVISIGNFAFDGCIGLTSVTISNGITSIGNSVFNDCTGLTSIEIPNSVTSIGEQAFKGCNSMTSLTIGNRVTSIGKQAFDGCSGLTSVILNSDSIASKTYTSSSDLSSIFGNQVKEYIIGNDVTSIGEYAFYNRSNVTSVTIGSSVTSIGFNAFSGCTGLKSITIPESVTTLNLGATFQGCTSLTDVYWNAKNCDIQNEDKSYYPPFYNLVNIKNIYFGSKVESIPACLCLGLSGLESISLPSSLTSIGDYSFYQCTNLTSITLPNSVKIIGNYAFYNCAGLRTVTMSNQVQLIGAHAFENCTRVSTINLPTSLTYIGIDAFKNTSFIASAGEWEDGIRYINTCLVETNPNEVSTNPIIRTGTTALFSKAFANCKNIESLSLPAGIIIIPDSAFTDCSRLTSIDIPNSVTSIGYDAFCKCSRLTSINIPNSVTSIGDEAFIWCSNLKSIEIPNSVINIGKQAFMYCRSLTSVTIPNSVISIDAETFYGCAGLKSIEIPNNIISIGEGAFEGCSSMTSVTIGNSVTSIGKYAFSSCTALKQITIGHAVERIGDYAFNECPTVMSIFSYLETPPTINNTVFAGFGTYKGVDLYVPVGAKVNYEKMDYWKDFYIIEGLPDVIDNKLYYTLDEETQTATLIISSLAELKPVIDGELIIPDIVVSNGKTYTVTAIDNSVFKDNSTITSLIIPSTITQIGDSAFYGSSITSITIGDTEKKPVNNKISILRSVAEESCCTIGAFAFANCKNLTDIIFSKNICAIGEGSFKGCTKLRTIYSNMQNPPFINETVFDGCGDLGNISLFVPVGSEETYKGMTIWQDFHISSETMDIEKLVTSQENATKLLRDGQVLILHGDKTYTITGQEVK